ncbi:MAG: uncharacterized protein QOK38_635 [Acidobacteriaceae bacterium]|nr:uncharacterized protein [Acidobacteriaceae bacterium]
MPVLDVPGVYIDEVTSPGVITGVGTSTAAFIGPALNGPINLPTRISSFDDFLKTYGQLQSNGSFNPFILTPKVSYLAFGVKAFYDNGGAQAYVVRVGTAKATAWDVKNANGEVAFRLQAQQQGLAGNNITVQVQTANATTAAGVALATAISAVASINSLTVTVADASHFRIGDTVTRDVTPEIFTNRATITGIQANAITLSAPLAGLVAGDKLRLASIAPAQIKMRLASSSGVFPGSIVVLKGDDANNTGTTVQENVLVQLLDGGGFATVATAPARTKTYNLASAVAPPVLISQEFRVIVNVPGEAAQVFDNLSLSPEHPGYVFSAINSADMTVLPPTVPPVAAIPQNLIPAVVGNLAIVVPGVDDNPSSIGATEYESALNALKDIEDVNMVLAPDAVANASGLTIQQDIVLHCVTKKDRFAILDSRLGAGISGPGSIAEQRLNLQADNGYAAIYYPWLSIKDPTSTGPIPRNMLVPPSGAMAGIYARTDNERGVHKAPANTDVRGVNGLERILSDAQQGPLNLAGVDVLRIFPGTAQVVVWGARTTVDPNINDWLYLNVRRLMIYIEQSIESGIRWAVFEPNGLPLWQQLKRTLNDFLTRVWQSGALFGATADKAFYVRIDEGLNPPSTRALGQLHIEIGVAPVRPAEFIVVRIGLWDGGAQISEN